MDPAERTFSVDSFGETGGAGDGDGEGVIVRLKLTLDSSLRNMPGFSSGAFSFPLLLETVANSSAAGAGAFLERVAVRKLCSREERIRVKGLIVDS